MLGYQYSQDIIWSEGSAKGWNENLQKHTCMTKRTNHAINILKIEFYFYREQLKNLVICPKFSFVLRNHIIIIAIILIELEQPNIFSK